MSILIPTAIPDDTSLLLPPNVAAWILGFVMCIPLSLVTPIPINPDDFLSSTSRRAIRRLPPLLSSTPGATCEVAVVVPAPPGDDCRPLALEEGRGGDGDDDPSVPGAAGGTVLGVVVVVVGGVAVDEVGSSTDDDDGMMCMWDL